MMLPVWRSPCSSAAASRRELGLEGADGGLELAVRAKCRRGVVELGGGPVVVLRLGVGLDENHLLDGAHMSSFCPNAWRALRSASQPTAMASCRTAWWRGIRRRAPRDPGRRYRR